MVPEQRMILRGKRQKQMPAWMLWQLSRKEVMRATIMETRGGDEFKKVCGRENWQHPVIIG
jgi:hypothetical protein